MTAIVIDPSLPIQLPTEAFHGLPPSIIREEYYVVLEV